MIKNKYSKPVYWQGFSIIELVIVLSIMGIMFSVGSANFRDFQRRRTVESVAENIRSEMRLAQQYAISGRKPQDCVDNDWTLKSYQVYQTDSIHQYHIGAVCDDGDEDTPDLSCPTHDSSYPSLCVRTIELPGNVNVDFTSTSTPPGVEFLVLARGAEPYLEVEISLAQTSYTQTVYIQTSGVLY